MDSGRFLLAVILMIAVVVLTNILFPPVPRRSTPAPTDSAAQTQPAPPAATQQPVDTPPAATPPPPAAGSQVNADTTPAVAARSDTIVVESPLFRYGISTNGAMIVSAELLNWKSFTREGPVQLAPRSPRGLLSYRLLLNNQTVDLSTLHFTPTTRHLRLQPGTAPQQLRLVHNSAAVGTIEVVYEFTADNYLADVSVAVPGNQSATRVQLNFGPQLAINEARTQEDEHALAYVVNSQTQGIRSYPLRTVKTDRIDEGPLDWVALKNKYFVMAAIIDEGNAAKPFGGVVAQPGPRAHTADVTASLPAEGNATFNYRLYLGPQEFDRLNAIGHKFQDVNPYGWRVFRPIIRPLGHFITWVLLGMHKVFGLSYGWILILFGIVIRLLMWPLNAKAMRSQLKNMELQPRMKELQTKYKTEPEKLQREMLKLYKEEGFNPMGGCLPMLIPFPVLITLFFVFQSTIQFRGVPFLWLPDLSQPDPIYVLPIVLGATMFFQQWLSMKTMPPNPQMKFMLWFMPLFMVLIFFNLASGLNLYYAAQNVPGFFQQMQLTKERERYQREKGKVVAVGKAK